MTSTSTSTSSILGYHMRAGHPNNGPDEPKPSFQERP
jgi:hypothetical protein